MSSGLPHRHRSEACLSDLVLDRWRGGELEPSGAASAAQHVSGCEACTARVQALDGAASRFGQEVWIEGEARRIGRRRLGPWVAGAGALAAGLVATLGVQAIIRRPAPSELTKGGGLTLGLLVQHPDGRQEEVTPGQMLSPRDAIRFVITPKTAAYLIILDLDATGAVTTWVPAVGEPTQVQPGRQVVDGSVLLDDAKGPERVVALLCHERASVPAVTAAGRAALAKAGGFPARLEALEMPCAQAAFSFLKVDRP